jgi:hypothetical protein
MRGMIGRLLLLFPLLALFSMASVAIGAQQPPSDWADVIRLDDCELPCWIGITPGETLLRDAEARLESAFGDSALYDLDLRRDTSEIWKRYVLAVRDTPLRMEISFDSMTITDGHGLFVEKIILRPYNATPVPITHPLVGTLARLTEQVSEVRVHTQTESPYLALVTSDERAYMAVAVRPDCRSALLHQEVVLIVLGAQPPRNRSGWLSGPLRWRGLANCYVSAA